jgi:hypothetical protein
MSTGDSSSSIWMRPLRRLFKEGIPPTQTVIATVEDSTGTLPFGVFAFTAGSRLIFWPVLPKKFVVLDEKGVQRDLDHVTLEFPNQRIHTTWFSENGKRKHHSAGWKLQPSAEPGLALWMKFLVRWSVLADQEHVVEQLVKMPTSDAKRRTSEFVQYANSIRLQPLKLLPKTPVGDYVFVVIGVVIDPSKPHQMSSDMLFCGGNIDDAVDGWPDGSAFGYQPVKIRVGEKDVVLAALSPPGTLKKDLLMGFPRTARQSG